MGEPPQSAPHISVVRQGELVNSIEQNGVWMCPLCPTDAIIYASPESVQHHIQADHDKKHVSHNGLKILKCNLDCGVLRKRSHFHCPYCDKAVISRGDFMFHLKGHDVSKGMKPQRGRRKTLATVMSNEAGVQNIQLFSHASIVVSPVILSLIEDHVTFWSQLEQKTGMTCLRDEGQQFCVLQGQYDSVIKANNFLEQYVLSKLDTEIADQKNAQQLLTDMDGTNDPIIVKNVQRLENGDIHTEQSSQRNDEVRKSSRKRKPNSLLDMYVTPKTIKLEPVEYDNHAMNLDSIAIRKSSVAHTLKTTVQQDCHVTLSKNMQSGEYQVYLMFPPPLITEPSAEETPPPEPAPEATDVLDDNPLVDIDDDDNDEDYKVDDAEAENAASEEEMDDADDYDLEEDTTVSHSSVMFRCNQCDLDFSSISQLVKHRESVHKDLLAEDLTSTSLTGDECETGEPIKCPECDYTCQLKQALKLHVSRNHREKQLECLDCGERFGPLIDLKTHIKETGHRKGHHTSLFKQIVECKMCMKKLQLKNLKMHIAMVHEKQKPHSCDKCGKMFGTRFLVKEHMESHKNMEERPRPYSCQICGQSFFKKLPLDEHLAKHEGKPQYSCMYCPKKFYHQSGWKRHLQHHGSDRPFHCETCGKSFKTSTNLSAHKMVHKPMAYMCMCGRTYQQKHTLKSHQEKCSMHQDVSAQLVDEQYSSSQRYMCGFCQQTFSDFDEVQEHVKQHVPDSVQMEVGQLDGTITIADQTGHASDVVGNTLEHLAMTATLEQQNMLTESRTLIVTDLAPDQIQHLVALQTGHIIEPEGQMSDAASQIIDGISSDPVESAI